MSDPAPRPDEPQSGSHVPVLVVGGGPVGLGIALELSLHGIASLVVEPRTTVSMLRPRAKTTSARTMEHFRRWQIAQTIRRRAPLPQGWSDAIVFCTTLLGREVTAMDHCLDLDLIHDDVAAEGAQWVPQPVVEQVMRETIETLASPRVAAGWTVTDVQEQRDGVLTRMLDGMGRARTVTSDYVVGCDGVHSVVRSAIGAELDGEVDGRPNFNIVFRSRHLAKHVRHSRGLQYWLINPVQPGGIGRMDLIDTWWCGAVGVTAEHGTGNAEAIVRNLLGDGQWDIDIEVLATDPWRARMAMATHWGTSRIFLAGDAAHQNPPYGGHGFNTGVGDAVNLGWKLGAVLNGWAPASLLDSYELERRPVAADTIAISKRNMAALPTELSDRRLVGDDSDFAAVQPIVAEAIHRLKYEEFHGRGLVLGTAYACSPIVATESADQSPESDSITYRPNAVPGSRLPHRWLDDDTSRYDTLGPEFSLLGDLDLPAARALSAAAIGLGIPLTNVPVPAAEAQRDFDAPLVLVRPDQHVAWRGARCPEPNALFEHVTGYAPT
jgi:2-polyprenyl-6-methoxyphenol hydroxylase-like FAD-dependent oxidoreductase